MRNVRRIFFLTLLLAAVLVSLPVSAAEQEQRKDAARSYGAIDVILYETSWCPYCKKARDLLGNMGVSLVVYDVEKDGAKRAEMLKKTGGSRGVPVIDVEGTVLRGYSAEEIRAAVEEQRKK